MTKDHLEFFTRKILISQVLKKGHNSELFLFEGEKICVVVNFTDHQKLAAYLDI